jgi:glucosamine--fructose-6-phosphate aminotransferase (isomerizing)
MCGIVGYVGVNQAAPFLLYGMKKLEYRGYDSAGVATLPGAGINLVKCAGYLEALVKRIGNDVPIGSTGIGHTRWATHGKRTDENAHPHLNAAGDLAIVHNGIIENNQELRAELCRAGYVFQSETDTEVIVHLIDRAYQGNLAEAVRTALRLVTGSYALVVMSSKHPGELIAVRQESPLIVAHVEGESFIASDIPAVLRETKDVYVMEDGEMAVVKANSIVFMDFAGQVKDKKVFHVTWEAVSAEKGVYDYFMLKEIHEQPQAIRATLREHLDGDRLKLDLGLNLNQVNRVVFVACGTAYHAGLIGRELMEKWARFPAETVIASEFAFRVPLLNEQTLVVVVSQSGETADTLEALKKAQAMGASVLAVINVEGSSIAREADAVFYTHAGPEMAVASTKAYTTQLAAMALLALHMAAVTGSLQPDEIASIAAALNALPAHMENIISQGEAVKEMVAYLRHEKSAFFIGRGLDWAVAQEGALKLKEITYIHAEAYAAGELKHGALALMASQVPVIAVSTQPDLYATMFSNVNEIKAREANILAFTCNASLCEEAAAAIRLPQIRAELAPLLVVVPLQLLAYYVAVDLGNDPDMPRNLAKSVTVH